MSWDAKNGERTGKTDSLETEKRSREMNTVQEIIGAVCTPNTVESFRRELIKQAETHDDFARMTRDDRARKSAIYQKNACLSIYDDAYYVAVGDICADLSKCVIALNVACKLLGISPATRTAAIVHWQETQVANGIWRD